MRKVMLIVIGVLAVMLIGSVLLIYSIVDDAPAVLEADQPTPQSLMMAKDTLKQIIRELQLPGAEKVISIDQQQLTEIFALVSDIFKNITARQNSSDNELIIIATVELPPNPFGRYININTFVTAGFTDTDIDKTSIGSLSFSNQSVVALASKVILWRAGDEFKSPEGDLVSDINMHQGKLMLYLNPELDTQQLLDKLKANGKQTLDMVISDDRFADVQYYYDYLVRTTRYIADSKISTSLFDYLKLALELARQRSVSGDAQKENVAALLAVSLYVGDYDLQRALSTLLKVNLSSSHKNSVTLAARQDLNLHFIYSVALTILSDQGVSLSIGEIKEVSDSAKGGSGFSFVDLTADRAGVQLAEFAISNPSTARLLQDNIYKINTESGVFPDIALLQEGLSEDQFKKDYGNRESADYRVVVSEIDRRIAALDIYKR
jgi:hypothetical protein